MKEQVLNGLLEYRFDAPTQSNSRFIELKKLDMVLIVSRVGQHRPTGNEVEMPPVLRIV